MTRNEADHRQVPLEMRLRVRSVAKRFGATRAVRNATFEVLMGEVHALVGENGSGKSTLVKLLSGVHSADSGEIVVGTESRTFRSPHESQAAGIATVFQEVLSVEGRNVLENLWLGADGFFRSKLSTSEKRRRAKALLDELMERPPDLEANLEDMPLSDRQCCSIARALLRQPRVLILDEATSALDFDSRARLFRKLRTLAAEGTSVILITHRMDEIEDIADRVTVLRSGETVASLARGTWTMPELVRHMTGAEELVPTEEVRLARRVPVNPEPAIEVKGLTLRPGSAPINVQFRRGELIGLAGLEGHGQDAFLQRLWGVDASAIAGSVIAFTGDLETDVRSPRQAARARIGYVPKERRTQSIFPWMSILDNFAVSTLFKDTFAGSLQPSRMATRFHQSADSLHIKFGHAGNAITTLSGGNQQKVIVARWLATGPRVLLLNDPTRGIDIGAKRDLYRLLAELTEDGLTVIMLSTEIDEHVELMDRVLVFREHECAATIPSSKLSRESLVSAFFGGGAISNETLIRQEEVPT